jgi:hypothetical protein
VAAEAGKNAKPLAAHGGPRKQVDKRKYQLGGPSAQYRADRLKRDHPEVA